VINPIWTPSEERIRRANLTAFIRHVATQWDGDVCDYASLHAFSVNRMEAFWEALWDFVGIIGDKGQDILHNATALPGASWFPQARLNFAENHLRLRDDRVALIARTEAGSRRVITRRELYDEVSRVRSGLEFAGVVPGDRVAACLPNVPEAVIALLAATSLGAIWSAVSPDYGEQALGDRIGQIGPKILFIADGYRYGGKPFDIRQKAAALVRSTPSLEAVVLVPHLKLDTAPDQVPLSVSWEEFASRHPGTIDFRRFGFSHPLWIVYSSGTTGKPKAILHGVGGSLLQCVKEIVLHCDAGPDDLTFFPTSTGWIVWNIMVCALAADRPILLYEGSPTFPDMDSMFGLISQERVGVARLVPPLIEAYAKAGLDPAGSHDLSSLKCLLSGSAPLLPHHYKYVYAHIKSDLHLMSPAGGTDIMCTLATGNPIGPVYPGEIQAPSLGMSVAVFDEKARSLVGQAGELVCTKTFPSVPLGFWGDDSFARVTETYFSKFPGVYWHGDWAELTPRGGIIIHGRSDATLNVNGVRIGTAEIYRGLESIPEIKEAVAVCHRRNERDQIVLFVTLAGDGELDSNLDSRIRQAIRDSSSARHVPERVIHMSDLPRSMNGKPSEIAVRDVIHGRDTNSTGLRNPESLELFRNLPGLQ
jgi:acetoacetyl-CoA synthetase